MQSLIKVHSYGVIIMDFDWERFIDVAEHLRNYSNREEYQRTAVGRYYYTCFLIARDIYYDMAKVPEGTFVSHESVITFFEKSKKDIEKDLGTKLRNLRRRRNNADYDKEFRFADLNDIKKRYKDIITLLDKLK